MMDDDVIPLFFSLVVLVVLFRQYFPGRSTFQLFPSKNIDYTS